MVYYRGINLKKSLSLILILLVGNGFASDQRFVVIANMLKSRVLLQDPESRQRPLCMPGGQIRIGVPAGNRFKLWVDKRKRTGIDSGSFIELLVPDQSTFFDLKSVDGEFYLEAAEIVSGGTGDVYSGDLSGGGTGEYR